MGYEEILRITGYIILASFGANLCIDVVASGLSMILVSFEKIH